jgi:protein ImuB
MSVLYCAIPHFAAALARRDDPELGETPLILVGSGKRVFGVSAEAADSGVCAGMTVRMAEVRCPEARLLEADVARCREETETLLRVLELTGPAVEPHGWGAAYVDLDSLARNRAEAIPLCREVGGAVRQELGEILQPALGWDSTKFTAQAAARHTLPGHLRAVPTVQERAFLRPLSVSLLPLAEDVLQRLCFLGLRTLGQYAALPSAAVWQQFGRAGMFARRCARGEDDRPVVPRWQATCISAGIEWEDPLLDRDRLLTALRHRVSPLLARLRGNLQACGQVRLTAFFDVGGAREGERTFLLPVADEERVMLALGRLLDKLAQSPGVDRAMGIVALSADLRQIQDAVPEQLALFPLEGEGHQDKMREVERYLVTRFGGLPDGGCRLRRPVLSHPGAPLPEWRVSWQGGDER